MSEPLNLADMYKDEALSVLRDVMATHVWEIMEEHCKISHRDDLGRDGYLAFMEERRLEYMHVNWKYDAWDEELTFYHDKRNPLPQKVREFVDNVRIDYKNAGIMAPVLVQRENDKKHDFNTYMHLNWDRDVRNSY